MNPCIADSELLPSRATIGASPTARRVRLFGMNIDPLRMPTAIAKILEWADDDDRHCRYVVTPNLDHAVLFQEHEGLRRAYAEADLVLVDGMPVLLAAKLLHRGIPERVAGSDLVPALFDAASRRFYEAGDSQRYRGAGVPPADSSLAPSSSSLAPRPSPLRIYLLGAALGVAERAAIKIEQRWPGVRIVGCDSPPIGFEKRADENDAILSRIAEADADVLIVGFGAPKQELWVHAHCRRIAAPVALCVGATIDFLAGERSRAPVWMRRIGLEWLHRMATEPRRLAKRYLRDAARFPGLLWGEFTSRTT